MAAALRAELLVPILEISGGTELGPRRDHPWLQCDQSTCPAAAAIRSQS